MFYLLLFDYCYKSKIFAIYKQFQYNANKNLKYIHFGILPKETSCISIANDLYAFFQICYEVVYLMISLCLLNNNLSLGA